MSVTPIRLALAVATSLLLSACSNSYDNSRGDVQADPVGDRHEEYGGYDDRVDRDYDRGYGDRDCANCGTIVDIDRVSEGDEGISPAGAVIGAVVGGLVGSQVGGGSGQDAATAIGAVGGAVAGNEVAQSSDDDVYYRVTVEMADGREKTVNVNSARGIDIGTDVRVVGNDLHVI